MFADGFEEWAEQFKREAMQRGLQEGRQEGLQEGLRQGERALLQGILIKRFGELPAWVLVRLRDAQPEQLERWAERLLEVDTLEALFERA